MSGWIWCWTNNPLGSSVHWADYGGESFTKAPVFQVKQTRSNQLYLCLIPSRYLRIPAKYENMYPSRKPIKYCLADVFCQMGNPPWRKKCLPKNLAELPLPCPPFTESPPLWPRKNARPWFISNLHSALPFDNPVREWPKHVSIFYYHFLGQTNEIQPSWKSNQLMFPLMIQLIQRNHVIHQSSLQGLQ